MDEWYYTLESNKIETIRDKLEVVPIEDKMRKTRLKWLAMYEGGL